MKSSILLLLLFSASFLSYGQDSTKTPTIKEIEEYIAYKTEQKAISPKNIGIISVKQPKIPVYCSPSVSKKMGYKKVSLEIKSGKIEDIDYVDCNYNFYKLDNTEKFDLKDVNYSKIKLWALNKSSYNNCEKSYINLSDLLYLDLNSNELPSDTTLNFTPSETHLTLVKRPIKNILTFEEYIKNKGKPTTEVTAEILDKKKDEPTTMVSTNAIDSMVSEKVDEQLKNNFPTFLEQAKIRIKSDADKKFLVGKLVLRNYKVNRYCRESTDEEIDIKRVKVIIENASITDIQIIDSNYEVFTNGNSPIELKRLNKRSDRLFSENGSHDKSCFKGYLKLSDIFYYEMNTIYTPKDTILVFENNTREHSLERKSGIDQHVDFRIYSDLLGLMGNESNGLIQTEFHVNSDLHQKNVWGSPWYFFKYFDFVFKASKFDSDYQNVDLSKGFNRADLNQRSWLNTTLNLNLLSLTNLKSRFNMNLDILGGFDVVEIQPDVNSILNIGLPKLGIVYAVEISSAPNFNANIKLPIIFQNSPYFSGKGLAVDNGMRTIIAPQIEFVWHPLENEEDGLFGRVTYVNVNGDGHPFWTFQVGYNLSLSGWFKTK